MEISKIFPNGSFKSADLKGREITRRINSVDVRDYDDGPRPLLRFDNERRTLPLSYANARALAGALGDNTDSWRGREIVIFTERVPYRDALVDAIRVRAVTK
jgi:hypothetical protein